ncbi:MAG: methylenetetrahydrofolate--tRNA-(uracil(54)-C(5))-methyltransferase (FADH(2)-oxidizing) TrmFO [Desulfocapsaceae bacterium]
MTTDCSRTPVVIIGGGLAGCEAAWQAARRGCAVSLYEMKPQKFSPAHQSQDLGELVCSNSLRSNDPHSAVGLLKDEMRALHSLIMEVADNTAVPAGKALAVDRVRFAATISEKISAHPLVSIVRKELNALPDRSTQIKVLATGPLTSQQLAEDLARFTGKERLYFYDAIAPIVSAESLDMQVIYRKSRYDDGEGDYLNCPMSQADYLRFINELSSGECTSLHDFEEPKYFEGCLPIEVMRSRGDDTLRFGPMKPVGLENPHTGEVPYAVVQLRMEDRAATHYNMVGFQTKLTYPEQKRIFQMIPGLQRAEFVRYGSIHRNTFICAPEILLPTLQTGSRPDLLIAGQLSGVEGYVESAAMGLLAGLNSARLCCGQEGVTPPAETALGSLVNHLTQSDPRHFQPSNINFGLFPPWEKKVPKRLRGEVRAQRSHAALQKWREIYQT